jgi:hypothetical protein
MLGRAKEMRREVVFLHWYKAFVFDKVWVWTTGDGSLTL